MELGAILARARSQKALGGPRVMSSPCGGEPSPMTHRGSEVVAWACRAHPGDVTPRCPLSKLCEGRDRPDKMARAGAREPHRRAGRDEARMAHAEREGHFRQSERGLKILRAGRERATSIPLWEARTALSLVRAHASDCVCVHAYVRAYVCVSVISQFVVERIACPPENKTTSVPLRLLERGSRTRPEANESLGSA